VNTGRRNVDLTYILLNNEVYGLTKGQAAPTLAMGLQTKSLPEPTIQGEVNALMLALASGFTWIGRGYAFNVKQLVELVQRAIRHPGLTFLEVLQPCPTYNDLHTKDWFAGTTADNGQPRVYALDQTDYHAVIPEGASEAVVSAQMQQFVAQAHEWVSVFQPVSFWKIGRFQVLKCASPRVSPATGRPLQLGGRSPMRKGGRWRICVRSEATSVL